MHRPLLVTDQDVGDVGVHQGIEQIYDRPARVTEDCLDAFFLEAFDYCL